MNVHPNSIPGSVGPGSSGIAPLVGKSVTQARILATKVTRLAVVGLTLGLLQSQPIHAHETDQYTLPVGRQFADLGPYFSRIVYGAVADAASDANTAIRRALHTHQPEQQVEELQSADYLAAKVWLHLFEAFPTNELLDGSLVSEQMRAQYPGLITAYRPEQSIYDDPLLLADLTKAVRTFFRACTVSANGQLFGTDKIIHFINLGRIYHSAYEDRRKHGMTDQQAFRATLNSTSGNPMLSEEGFLGMYTTGIHSNGDLSADIAGFKFYRNLTEPVRLGARVMPPMLVRDGPYWKLQIRPDSDFFTAFISAHWNEALNPNAYQVLIDDRVRVMLRERCADLREWYRDAHGHLRTREQFEAVERELATYYGEEYGFESDGAKRVSIATTCFEKEGEQVRRGESVPAAKPATAPRPPGNQVDAMGRSALWWAARDGLPAEVELLLAEGSDPNAADGDGETPLHAAVRSGRTDVVRVLVAHGANVDSAALYGVTPLMLATTTGQAESAEALLLAGASPNTRDLFGNSALHAAARAGSFALTDLLLAHAADPVVADDAGNTPLHLAARAGSQTVVNMLLAHGADAGVRNAHGATASDEARREGNGRLAQSLDDPTRSARPSSLAAGRPASEATRGRAVGSAATFEPVELQGSAGSAQ